MQRHIRRHSLGVLDAERDHLSASVQAIQQLPALVLIIKVLESALLLLDPVSILPRKRGLNSVNLSSLGSHYCCWLVVSDLLIGTSRLESIFLVFVLKFDLT